MTRSANEGIAASRAVFDALVDLLLGILLLMSPFTTLYAALQLPQPQPALFGQLLGVALVGLAVLLWQATFNGQLTVPVARTAGYVNLASAVLIIAWMVFMELPLVGAGKIWLPVMAVVLAFFALVQIPASRRVRNRERQLKAERALQEQEHKKEVRKTRRRPRGAPNEYPRIPARAGHHAAAGLWPRHGSRDRAHPGRHAIGPSCTTKSSFLISARRSRS